ncbi:MAG: type II secretion system protein [Peptococcaceae bacterium]|nr:type II secretion system protein [Peptococcaceae bacterium]
MYKKKDCGMTLLEVLLSLVITGIIVSIILPLYTNQYRLSKEIACKAETDFTLLRAGQVLTSAVQEGIHVEWKGEKLFVTFQQSGKTIVDSFYLADKDRDGILDLYREHLGVPNPVVSGLKGFNCSVISDKLWRISLLAVQEGKEVSWERKVRQRI